ncbi:MAG: SsrA-binding protein SmpB [Candidatus Nomurabacteria bacterium]|jgi:SsrA-binding protein|nr:SsrA-binding protein SmpB [Candidatus Nomurabacteria bacterium]
MKKSSGNKSITNRRASFDYALGEELLVGLVLTGGETKAARLGHVHLKGSYVTVKDNELWLINASFSVMTGERGGGKTVETRSRKLLAKRAQIDKLIKAKKDGLTIVPIRLLNQRNFIKLVIATGRGKKRYDKREAIKKREQEREARRNF